MKPKVQRDLTFRIKQGRRVRPSQSACPSGSLGQLRWRAIRYIRYSVLKIRDDYLSTRDFTIILQILHIDLEPWPQSRTILRLLGLFDASNKSTRKGKDRSSRLPRVQTEDV